MPAKKALKTLKQRIGTLKKPLKKDRNPLKFRRESSCFSFSGFSVWTPATSPKMSMACLGLDSFPFLSPLQAFFGGGNHGHQKRESPIVSLFVAHGSLLRQPSKEQMRKPRSNYPYNFHEVSPFLKGIGTPKKAFEKGQEPVKKGL